MYTKYAGEFRDIPAVLRADSHLQEDVLDLVLTEPMPGKVTESKDRLEKFRAVLSDIVTGKVDLATACSRVSQELPQHQSPHSRDVRVFPRRWEERAISTQVSRVYNQAVLEDFLAEGITTCYVPHTSVEQAGTSCALYVAGRTWAVSVLYAGLVSCYRDGDWTTEPRIPSHPHCSHVVTPVP